jgi:endonuclease/exonuclease/phosphatase family metal-dependent hydrolase
MRSFSLLTFNCFGVPGMGTGHRLHRLAQELNHAAYTVVCLQEVQSHHYRKLLVEACGMFYPSRAYKAFLHAPKGGLLTLSQCTIETLEFILYRERGLWYTPALADWILHKGILISRLKFDQQLVIVINTHLTANYSANWSKTNRFARQEYRELLQLAEVVQQQPPDALVIVCGDFNIPRGSWLYQSFLEASGLLDPLAGNHQPTYRPHPALPARYAAAIDFTFYRPLPDLHVESRLCFQEKVTMGKRHIHLSDHLGVELELSWSG